jgi:hypothetical protein
MQVRNSAVLHLFKGFARHTTNMPDSADHAENHEFLQLEGRINSEGGPLILSRAAFELHGHGIINSVRNDTPGFVSDEYLNGLSADTAVSATELCMVGLWRRTYDGYDILDREMLEIAIEQNRRMNDAARRDATGGHEPDPNAPTDCRNCRNFN